MDGQADLGLHWKESEERMKNDRRAKYKFLIGDLLEPPTENSLLGTVEGGIHQSP